MRAFLVLALVATASAALLPGGYNYGPGQSGTFQTVSGSIVGPGGYKLSAELVGSESHLIGSGVNAAIGSSRVVDNGLNLNGNTASYNSGNSYGAEHISSSSGHLSSTGDTRFVGLHTLDSIPQTVEYSKQFYHFSAPEEHHSEGVNRQQLSNVLKKNLQVVFIKAPENNAAANAALQLAKQAIEQRTAIYVLTKENDASQTVAQLQQIQEITQSAPEVKFIKYRTQQDIAHAKEEIQSQYDNFGGAAQNFDGGVVPVLNFASNVGGLGHDISHVNAGVGSSDVSAGSVKYVSGSTGSFGGLTGNVDYVSGGSNNVGTVESLGVLTGGANYVTGSTGSLSTAASLGGSGGNSHYVSGGSDYVNNIGPLSGSAGGNHYVSDSTKSLKGLDGGVNYVSGGSKHVGTIGSLGESAGSSHYVSGGSKHESTVESLGVLTGGGNYVTGSTGSLGAAASLGGSAGNSHYVSGGSNYVNTIGPLSGSAGGNHYVSGSTESLKGLTGGVNYVSGGSKHVGTIGSVGESAGSSHYVSGESKQLHNIGSLGGSAESTHYVSGSSGSSKGITGGVNYVSGGSKHIGTILSTSQYY